MANPWEGTPIPKKQHNLSAVMSRVLQEAKNREMDAAHGGRHDDGGATDLRTAVRYYQYGQQGVLPPEWQAFADQEARQQDPEYAEYQRLKAKFKDDQR